MLRFLLVAVGFVSDVLVFCSVFLAFRRAFRFVSMLPVVAVDERGLLVVLQILVFGI